MTHPVSCTQQVLPTEPNSGLSRYKIPDQIYKNSVLVINRLTGYKRSEAFRLSDLSFGMHLAFTAVCFISPATQQYLVQQHDMKSRGLATNRKPQSYSRTFKQSSSQQLNLTTTRVDTSLLNYRVFQLLGRSTANRNRTWDARIAMLTLCFHRYYTRQLCQTHRLISRLSAPFELVAMRDRPLR